MSLHDLIFTEQKPERYIRHILFWLSQCAFWGLWATVFRNGFSYEYFIHQLQRKQYFLPDIIYTYFIVYYLSPKFLFKGKTALFIITVLACTLITYVLFIHHKFLEQNLGKESTSNQLLLGWHLTMNFITSGPPVVCAIFLTFKMIKNFYIKVQEKIFLSQENTKAELQLLNAQIHPHFLFNTLNNIYAFVLTGSPMAGKLVLKLSHILRYMINDCGVALVPLAKEVKMIEDYMEIERVRYGNRLDLQVTIQGQYQNKLIAPLLIIPFVENCFKHGVAVSRGQQWIRVFIHVEDDQCFFEFANSHQLKSADHNRSKGIGLVNVQKRLQLLYPGKYTLVIVPGSDRYMVKLQVSLQRFSAETEKPILNPQPAYHE